MCLYQFCVCYEISARSFSAFILFFILQIPNMFPFFGSVFTKFRECPVKHTHQKFVVVNLWCESWHLHGFCFLLGDGGNDVSMIQEADCGVGVEGKVRPRPSHWLTLACRSHRFSLRVSCQDHSHVQRHGYRWFLCTGIYCLSRGNEDDRMPLCSNKSESLSSGAASLSVPCQDRQFDMALILYICERWCCTEMNVTSWCRGSIWP